MFTTKLKKQVAESLRTSLLRHQQQPANIMSAALRQYNMRMQQSAINVNLFNTQQFGMSQLNNMQNREELSTNANNHETKVLDAVQGMSDEGVKPTSLMQRLMPWILNSERKPPKGFEKFFKKKDETQKSGSGDEKKLDKKDDKKPDKESQEEKIEEEEEDDSDKKGGADSAKGGKDDRAEWQKFLFDQNNNPKPEGFLALLLGGSILYYVLTYKKPMQELVYKDFLNDYLLKNNVKEITITKDKRSEVFNYRAEITTMSGEKFYMTLGAYESFLAKLDLVQREMGRQPHEFVPVKYNNQSEEQMSNLMMNLLVGSLFLLFFYQIYKNRNSGGAGGAGGKAGGKTGTPGQQNKSGGGWFQGQGGMGDMFNYGKSNATVYGEEKKIKVKFANVAGNENAKIEIMEFVDFLKDPKKYQKLGARVPRGALLVGPPGCGKTLLAKAVAGESKVPFFSISGSDFVEMFVGVGASRVRDLFKKARQKAPSIIFIDEIDAVGKKRHGKMGGGNDERDNTLNQLLVEMDGFSTDTSVIVLAATNRKDMLDSALLRPGRFDRTIEITLPSIKEREQIFNVHLKKIKLNEKLTKEEYARKLAALTPGFSGADIKNICNEGAIISARKSLESVSIKEFEEATERVIAGIEKKLPLSDFERKTVAFHEAGHAVAGWFLEHSSPLLKLTIIPRAKGSLGFAQYLPDELNLYNREQLEDMIVMALGGRVSEELFFNRLTTGASDDIKKITQIAQSLVTQYGMSPVLGPVNYDIEEGYQKPYSDKTNRMIDAEVKAIIDRAYIKCKAMLAEKKELIQKLGETLLQKETLALPDIVDILGPRPFPLKESLQEYLQELRERTVEEQEAAAAAKSATEESSAKSDTEDKNESEQTTTTTNIDDKKQDTQNKQE